MSGTTTMIGGGTGPATGTNATTCTPGPWHLARMIQAADAFPMNLGFLGKGNASEREHLRQMIPRLPPAALIVADAGYVGYELAAALVAAGVTPVALGSETGGSVRQPASFCGVVGLKPTYGRVSRHGLVSFGSSLDCISIFGEKVDDTARLLEVISGHDPLDATSAALPPAKAPAPRTDLKGVTLGLPEEYGVFGGVFADVGSLWDLDETAGSMGEVDDGFHLRSSVGVSLFVDTPLAPLRFNYSVPLKREDYDVVERFRFTIESRF